MKILLITEAFPPKNVIASVRWAKMSKYLIQAGNEVRIITSANRISTQSENILATEIPEKYIYRVDREFVSDYMHEDYYSFPKWRKIFDRIRILCKHRSVCALLRDDALLWVKPSVKQGRLLLKDWTPDVIISSALPIASHLIARLLQKACNHNALWLAEYRDLWSSGPGAQVQPLQAAFFFLFEKWLLKPTYLLITVSEPLANFLRSQHRKEILTIYNGFDPDVDDEKKVRKSFSYQNKFEMGLGALSKAKNNSPFLNIFYFGSVYNGRDPSLLFEAINLSHDLSGKIFFNFFTNNNESIIELADKYEVREYVSVSAEVSHKDCLQLQRKADVLLHIGVDTGDGPQHGVLSGKAFEYLQANAPIVAINTAESHPLVADGLMSTANTVPDLIVTLTSLLQRKEHGNLRRTKRDLMLRKKWTTKAQVRKLLERLSTPT